MIVVRYAGLLTVFIIFFSNEKYFSSEDRPCKWLRFIGRRTLDIYMLHVFLLPNLIYLNPYLTGKGMLLVQLVIALSAAIINIALCLCLSNMLRSSQFLSRWLFGEK
jgi:peptidoglycan/LPS O-acetylase OafA/YrhL